MGVPLTVPILTKRGWMKYNEIVPDDVTLGRTHTGTLEWTPIREVRESEAQPIWLIDSPQARLLCTKDHLWLVGRRKWRRISEELHPFGEFLKDDSIIVSGYYPDERNEVKESVARLYGLVVAGRAAWRKRDREWTLHIVQSDKQSGAYIMDVLERIPHRAYRQQGQMTFVVAGAAVKAVDKLMQEPIEKAVWRMSNRARQQFLAGIFEEVYEERVSWELALAAFLGDNQIQRRPHYQVRRGTLPLRTTLIKEYGQEMPVWCPQTDLGTWTMLQDDQPIITGGGM